MFCPTSHACNSPHAVSLTHKHHTCALKARLEAEKQKAEEEEKARLEAQAAAAKKAEEERLAHEAEVARVAAELKAAEEAARKQKDNEVT